MKDIKNIFDYSPHREKSNHPFKFDRAIHTKDDVRELNRLLKIVNHGRKRNWDSDTRTSSGRARSYREYQQRVVFKNTNKRNLNDHKRYIREYIRQMDKKHVIEKPEVWGTPDEEYYANIVPLHFKCMISPENTDMDYETLTRCFVSRIEYLTGHGLYWKAAIHNDTGHRHIHLCINGKDTEGKDIFFEREMIKNTMREMLKDIATKMIGPRTQKEIEMTKKRQLTMIRWTNLDKKIEKMQDNLWTQTIPQPMKYRLEFLSKIGLATIDVKKCHVAPEWKEVLQANTRYNTFMEVYSSSKIPVHLYEGGTIRGKISKVVTFEKDEAWNHALVIDQEDKKIYVPVYQLHKENLLGKQVEISGGTQSMSRQLTDKNIRILNHNDITY